MITSKYTTFDHLSNIDFFRAAQISLRIVGIWPMDPGPLPIRFYVNYVLLFTSAVFGVTHGFVHLNNIFLALESFCGSIVEFVSWYEYCLTNKHLKLNTFQFNLILVKGLNWQRFIIIEASSVSFFVVF